MSRKPYPFPTLQNDTDFAGSLAKQVDTTTKTLNTCAKNPWNRLNETATLSSSRREVFHHDPQAPNDSLDFVIKSTYDNHNEFLKSSAETLEQMELDCKMAPNDSLDFVIKSTYDNHNEFLKSSAETLVQPETAGCNHGRVLKNRPPTPPPKVDMRKLPLVRSTADKRESIHSVNGAIESHHSAATNGGYSRKHDGGFYTC